MHGSMSACVVMGGRLLTRNKRRISPKPYRSREPSEAACRRGGAVYFGHGAADRSASWI